MKKRGQSWVLVVLARKAIEEGVLEMVEGALHGVRVLEWAQFVAGPYCAKLLADLGAEVIKVEEPAKGDEARSRGPFLNDIPHPERSGLFLYLNTNKFGITLNPKTDTGKRIFQKLAEDADILIEDKAPGAMEELGLAHQTLNKINPRLIMTSITPFGQTGPYAKYKAYCLNSVHSGFLGNVTPHGSPNPDREPLKWGGLASEYACGLISAVAILAALYTQRLTGLGQHVDVSKQEALICLNRVLATSYSNEGVVLTRLRRRAGSGYLLPCKDGHVIVDFQEENQWLALGELIGNPELASDERFKGFESRLRNSKQLEPLIREWMKNHSKAEIYHWGQPSVAIGPVASAEEVVNSEQSKARGFFFDIDHPVTGKAKYPTAPYLFSKTPWACQRPAPLLGEHNEEVYCRRLGYGKQDLVKLRQAGII